MYDLLEHWISTTSEDFSLLFGFKAGKDRDGNPIYVGRVYNSGAIIPGTINHHGDYCYVTAKGAEIKDDRYEILSKTYLDWKKDSKGNVPEEAIRGGYTADREGLYIGRVDHDGTQTIGKIHPSHQVCYIPYHGKELGFSDYDVLVYDEALLEAHLNL